MPILRKRSSKRISQEERAKSDEESLYGDGSTWPFQPTIRFLTDLMKLRRCGKASADAACTESADEYTKTLCDDTQMDQSFDPESSAQSSPSPTDKTEGFREHRLSQPQLSPKRKYTEKSVKKYKKSRTVEEQLLKLERERLKLLASNTAAKEDSDLQFLKSLLPYLKTTPSHRKLTVRQKIQQVLLDEQLDDSSTVNKKLLRPKFQQEFQDKEHLNLSSSANQPRFGRKRQQESNRHKLKVFEDKEQLNHNSKRNKPRLRRKLQKIFENEEQENHNSSKINQPPFRQTPRHAFQDEEQLNHNSTPNQSQLRQKTQQISEDEELLNISGNSEFLKASSTPKQPQLSPKLQQVFQDEEEISHNSPTQSPLPPRSHSIEESCLTVASSTHSSETYLSPSSVSSSSHTPLYYSKDYQQICSIRSTSSYQSVS